MPHSLAYLTLLLISCLLNGPYAHAEEPPETSALDQGALKRACKDGQLDACRTLGSALAYGLGTKQKPKVGIKWLKRACADEGAVDGAACLHLAELHLSGEEMRPDPDAADEFAALACAQGNGWGCVFRGMLAIELVPVNGPVLAETDRHERTREFIQQACDLKVWESCQMLTGRPLYVLMADAAELGPLGGPAPSEAQLDAACSGGSERDCYELGIHLVKQGDEAKALPIFTSVCRGYSEPIGIDPKNYYGMPPAVEACFSASQLLAFGRGVPQDVALSLQLRAEQKVLIREVWEGALRDSEYSFPDRLKRKWREQSAPNAGFLSMLLGAKRLLKDASPEANGKGVALLKGLCAQGHAAGLEKLISLAERAEQSGKSNGSGVSAETLRASAGECIAAACSADNPGGCGLLPRWAGRVLDPGGNGSSKRKAEVRAMVHQALQTMSVACDDSNEAACITQLASLHHIQTTPELLAQHPEIEADYGDALSAVELLCRNGVQPACIALSQSPYPLSRAQLFGVVQMLMPACHGGEAKTCSAINVQLNRLPTEQRDAKWESLKEDADKPARDEAEAKKRDEIAACERGDLSACRSKSVMSARGVGMGGVTQYQCDHGDAAACVALATPGEELPLLRRACFEGPKDESSFFREGPNEIICKDLVLKTAGQKGFQPFDESGPPMPLDLLRLIGEVCISRGLACMGLEYGWSRLHWEPPETGEGDETGPPERPTATENAAELKSLKARWSKEMSVIQGGLKKACGKGWPKACEALGYLSTRFTWLIPGPDMDTGPGIQSLCNLEPRLRIPIVPKENPSRDIASILRKQLALPPFLPTPPTSDPDNSEREEAHQMAAKACGSLVEGYVEDFAPKQIEIWREYACKGGIESFCMPAEPTPAERPE